MQGAQNLINDPVSTISAVPEAVFSVFGRVSEAAKRGGRSQYEDGVAQNLLAVSSFKREYAQKLDFDVYSSNEVLQKQLNSVAWASAAGNLTLGAASVVTGAAVLQVASGLRTLDQAKNIVNALPAAELSRRNREALRQMRIPDPVADRCPALSGDGGAHCRLSSAVTPIQRLTIYQNIPVAYTGQGAAVILLPIGRLLCTERSSGIAASLAHTLPKPPPARPVEIWMTGDASDHAREGLQQLGITLVEHAGQRLPMLD